MDETDPLQEEGRAWTKAWRLEKHGDGMYRGNTKSSKTNVARDLKYYPI